MVFIIRFAIQDRPDRLEVETILDLFPGWHIRPFAVPGLDHVDIQPILIVQPVGRGFPAHGVVSEGNRGSSFPEALSHGAPDRAVVHPLVDRRPVPAEAPDDIGLITVAPAQPAAVDSGIFNGKDGPVCAPERQDAVAPGRQSRYIDPSPGRQVKVGIDHPEEGFVRLGRVLVMDRLIAVDVGADAVVLRDEAGLDDSETLAGALVEIMTDLFLGEPVEHIPACIPQPEKRFAVLRDEEMAVGTEFDGG